METVESGVALRHARFVQPVPRLVSVVSDSGFHTVGLITLDLKCAGARSAGNPHATCDVAGVGDEITELPTQARRWKRRIQPRKFLRIYAPALDPTEELFAYSVEDSTNRDVVMSELHFNFGDNPMGCGR